MPEFTYEAMAGSGQRTHGAMTANSEREVVSMLDANLRLVQWNQRFAEFTGVPESLLQVGMPMETILRAQASLGEFGAVEVHGRPTDRDRASPPGERSGAPRGRRKDRVQARAHS